MATPGERMASLEVRLEQLEHKVDKMDAKLDDLLALRYKGMGAFWLASTIVGTGVIGFLWQAFHWFKGN